MPARLLLQGLLMMSRMTRLDRAGGTGADGAPWAWPVVSWAACWRRTARRDAERSGADASGTAADAGQRQLWGEVAAGRSSRPWMSCRCCDDAGPRNSCRPLGRRWATGTDWLGSPRTVSDAESKGRRMSLVQQQQELPASDDDDRTFLLDKALPDKSSWPADDDDDDDTEQLRSKTTPAGQHDDPPAHLWYWPSRPGCSIPSDCWCCSRKGRRRRGRTTKEFRKLRKRRPPPPPQLGDGDGSGDECWRDDGRPMDLADDDESAVDVPQPALRPVGRSRYLATSNKTNNTKRTKFLYILFQRFYWAWNVKKTLRFPVSLDAIKERMFMKVSLASYLSMFRHTLQQCLRLLRQHTYHPSYPQPKVCDDNKEPPAKKQQQKNQRRRRRRGATGRRHTWPAGRAWTSAPSGGCSSGSLWAASACPGRVHVRRRRARAHGLPPPKTNRQDVVRHWFSFLCNDRTTRWSIRSFVLFFSFTQSVKVTSQTLFLFWWWRHCLYSLDLYRRRLVPRVPISDEFWHHDHFHICPAGVDCCWIASYKFHRHQGTETTRTFDSFGIFTIRIRPMKKKKMRAKGG